MIQSAEQVSGRQDFEIPPCILPVNSYVVLNMLLSFTVAELTHLYVKHITLSNRDAIAFSFLTKHLCILVSVNEGFLLNLC